MFETDKTLDRELFAFTPRDWLPKDCDVWLYEDLFNQLDLTDFERDYLSHGRPGKAPRLILRTIFYGLSHGVTSIRKLTIACHHDIRYVVLSGNLRPDRRTFDRFICRHDERLKGLFSQVVRLACEMGLASLGRIAIDGSRFKAHTSREKSMKYEKMDRAIGYIEAELEALKQDLKLAEDQGYAEEESRISKDFLDKSRRIEKIKKAKEKIEQDFASRCSTKKSDLEKQEMRKSLHDCDAQSMASRGKEFIFGYNAQAVVDADSQIIVGAAIHDKATDYEALPVMLTEVKKNCGQRLNGVEVLADLGYKSLDNIECIDAEGAKPILPFTSDNKTRADVHFSEQVRFCPETNRYHCLAGKKLVFNNKTKIEFRFAPGFCSGCVFASQCAVKGRTYVIIPPKERLARYNELLQYSRTVEFAEIYKKRKAIVEPVFGNIKYNKLSTILVTSLAKVSVWWKMVCTAHNIEKIVRSRQAATRGEDFWDMALNFIIKPIAGLNDGYRNVIVLMPRPF